MSELDIWLEALTVADTIYGEYWAMLDDGERGKARRFVREIDRRRYVISHAKLRLILATYLQCPPQAVVFSTNDYGKPFVFDAQSRGIEFNLAHSGDRLLVGVCRGYPIGVDIEVWSENVDYEAVMELCFSADERRFWTDLPAARKTAFFYRLWTRKECFAKAVGLGLSLDVSKVNSMPIGEVRFSALPRGCGSPDDWSLADLLLGEVGMSAAVTIGGGWRKTAYRRFRL